MGGDLKIRVGIFSSVLRKSICVRSRECNFISLMDFDARNGNPTFFANYSTENWIIHGFEVMKGNVMRVERRERSDNFKNRVYYTNAKRKNEKKNKTKRMRKKAHDERRKERNPDNSGTTLLLYHNRLIDYEIS